jgi:translation initiation factor 4B
VADKRDRARKEAEEKARAEKAEKQRQAKEKAKAEKGSDANGAKDTDPDAPKKSNFELLRRAGEDESGMAADGEYKETTEESTAAKEATNEAAASKPATGATSGSWRKAEPAAAANEADEEGWSTVSTGKRNKGRGRGY